MTLAEIERAIRATRKEMRDKGIRRISCFRRASRPFRLEIGAVLEG